MAEETTAPSMTHRFMAAYAVAENVTALSPVAPDSVNVAPHSDWGYIPDTFEWQIGVQLSFRSVDDVRQFAKALFVQVAERPHGDTTRTYTFADGVLNGVPFRAWVLTDAAAVAA